MSDDLEKLRHSMSQVGGHIQDLQAEQSATTRELGTATSSVTGMQAAITELQATTGELQKSVKGLEARSVHMESTMAALGGTFASIERIMTDVLTNQARQK
ncbi:MAG: hypothetical protein ACYCW6_11895 [Candidatus Xenobia bacterium]